MVIPTSDWSCSGGENGETCINLFANPRQDPGREGWKEEKEGCGGAGVPVCFWPSRLIH